MRIAPQIPPPPQIRRPGAATDDSPTSWLRFTAVEKQFHNSRVKKSSFTFHLHYNLFTDLCRSVNVGCVWGGGWYIPQTCVSVCLYLCIRLIQIIRLSFGNLKLKLQNTRTKYVTSHTSGLLTSSPWYSSLYEEVFCVKWNISERYVYHWSSSQSILILYFVFWNLDFVFSRENLFWFSCIYVCKRINLPLPTEMELTHGGECRIDHWKLIFSLRR